MTQHHPFAVNPREDWLASSSRLPGKAHDHWYRQGRPALLPTGVIFDAVRMPAVLVHAAVGSAEPDSVAGELSKILKGPVIAETGWYYALVPPRTTETWRSPLAVVRGRGAWLTVPRVDHTKPRHSGCHWSVPVEQVGKLCDPAGAAELLQVGRERLEDSER
ncbi:MULTISPECIES: hypothetical protein [unclassified Streptomyces]|uniref:hypothetical protein n=1 Tax=unclassified Streptomyces TaxID=2593676 RepID=UPI00081D9EB9|nr:MULTISPECIES: hypothetical protein [unclassified Streptomyces]MYZ36663.1 hypothetical protein [Streptomyces sp. SID4917]SCF85320.1 hypothetical protein GA0115259_103639 [Streptomyces sp. MnatMP-M17]